MTHEEVRAAQNENAYTIKLYRSIRNGEAVRDQTSPAHIALKLAGIVKRDQRGMLVLRNPIYGRLFTDEWAVQTAETDTQRQVELAGWKKAAEIHVQTLRDVLDNYEVAFSQYQSLCNNPVFDKREADELWAQFFERRALREEQCEHRDEALLWRIQTLSIAPDETRARAIGQLLGADYPQLRMTLHHQRAISSVVFSPEGGMLLTGSDDGTARLWDAVTGAAARTPTPCGGCPGCGLQSRGGHAAHGYEMVATRLA